MQLLFNGAADQFGEESMAQSSTRFSVHSSDPCWHSRPWLVFFAFPYATYLPSSLRNFHVCAWRKGDMS